MSISMVRRLETAAAKCAFIIAAPIGRRYQEAMPELDEVVPTQQLARCPPLTRSDRLSATRHAALGAASNPIAASLTVFGSKWLPAS